MDDSWKLTLRVFDWQSMDSNHLDRKKAWLQKKIVHLSYSHFLSLTLTFCLSPSLTLSTSHFRSLTPFMQLCSSRRCHLGSSKQLRHNKCILRLRGHHWLWHQIQIQICTNTRPNMIETHHWVCRDAFDRGKAKTFIDHLNGVLLDTDGVSIDTDIVFQDDSIILTSNDCQQSS